MRRAVMVRVLLAVPAAEQFASCLRPSRYQVSTEPGAACGARQMKARLSFSRSVHEASGRPSMVGPGSLSPAGAPEHIRAAGGGCPPTQGRARPRQGLTCQAERREAEQQQRGESSPRAAPEAPHRSRPGSALGERQVEQRHGHIPAPGPCQPGVQCGRRMQPGRTYLELCRCALPVLQRGAEWGLGTQARSRP